MGRAQDPPMVAALRMSEVPHEPAPVGGAAAGDVPRLQVLARRARRPVGQDPHARRRMVREEPPAPGTAGLKLDVGGRPPRCLWHGAAPCERRLRCPSRGRRAGSSRRGERTGQPTVVVKEVEGTRPAVVERVREPSVDDVRPDRGHAGADEGARHVAAATGGVPYEVVEALAREKRGRRPGRFDVPVERRPCPDAGLLAPCRWKCGARSRRPPAAVSGMRVAEPAAGTVGRDLGAEGGRPPAAGRAAARRGLDRRRRRDRANAGGRNKSCGTPSCRERPGRGRPAHEVAAPPHGLDEVLRRRRRRAASCAACTRKRRRSSARARPSRRSSGRGSSPSSRTGRRASSGTRAPHIPEPVRGRGPGRSGRRCAAWCRPRRR